MNSGVTIDLHKPMEGFECSECRDCKPIKEITLRSIYAKCIKVFESWPKCLKASGIDMLDHQRKVPSREPNEYLADAFDLFESTPNWTSNIVRRDRVCWNLRHERNQGALEIYNKDCAPDLVKEGRWLFAAWVQYKAKSAGLNSVQYFKSNRDELWSEYRENHLAQEVWEEGRLENEVRKAFAQGRRITRYELADSDYSWDKTLLAATRSVKKRASGEDHNDILRKAGFIPKTLQAIYQEEDDPWTRVKCLKEAQKLMSIHLETLEPTLSREWCAQNAKEFHDALLRKVNGNSWESGLRWIGLDPKHFSLNASTRTKRGLVFQDFFRECLKEIGFTEIMREEELESEFHFLHARSLAECSHDVKCRPDFLFKDFLIDTKTGIGAINENNDQLSRYCDHRKIVYLVTLNNNHSSRRVGSGVVVTFSFRDFVINSEHILGKSITSNAPERLSQVLRETVFDNTPRQSG